MTLEKDSIQIQKDKHLREVVVKSAQRDFSDPNLSEAFKDASLEVSLEELDKLKPDEG